jgi:hypothetical protein
MNREARPTAAAFHHHLAEKEKAPNSIGIRGERRCYSVSF